jgi:uracil-DNA glycosylase family 4
LSDIEPSTSSGSPDHPEGRGSIKLVPTFHPAFLLRSPDRKRDVWEDMKKVRSLLAESPE